MFNHLALGINSGLEGVGLSVAVPVGPVIQLRAGYSNFLFPLTLDSAFLSEYGLKDFVINGEHRSVSSMSAKLGLNTGGGNLLCDIFLSKTSGFHFTVGAFITDPRVMALDFDASKVLKADEYASYGLQLDPSNPNTNITSDKNGHIQADLKAWMVRPYVGLGFGRAVDPEHRVRFAVDLGLMVWGSPTLYSYDYSLTNVKSVEITSDVLSKSSLKGAAGIVKLLSEIPVYPTIRLNLFIRLF